MHVHYDLAERAVPWAGLFVVREDAPSATAPTSATPRLLDQVRNAVRARHYSRRTERAYTGWIRRFILFHGKRHPTELGEAEVTRFLTHLAVRGRVSASTQNQALSALLFLYRQVLGRDLEWLDEVVRARRPVRLPIVLSRDDVAKLLREMRGVERIMASLLYGAGLRLLECCRLRVKDMDFARSEITVRDGKGGKDRITLLPSSATAPLAAHLERIRHQHDGDLRACAGSVELPRGARTQVPTGPVGVGLAVGVSRYALLPGSGDTAPAPPSPARICASEGRTAGGPQDGPLAPGDVSHASRGLCMVHHLSMCLI